MSLQGDINYLREERKVIADQRKRMEEKNERVINEIFDEAERLTNIENRERDLTEREQGALELLRHLIVVYS